MKRTSYKYIYKYIIFSIVALSIGFLSGATNAAEPQSISGLLAANDQSTYDVPETKQQKWQSLQNLVEKELYACEDDCGNDNACLDRCDEVYRVRLDREHKKLMSE